MEMKLVDWMELAMVGKKETYLVVHLAHYLAGKKAE